MLNHHSIIDKSWSMLDIGEYLCNQIQFSQHANELHKNSPLTVFKQERLEIKTRISQLRVECTEFQCIINRLDAEVRDMVLEKKMSGENGILDNIPITCTIEEEINEQQKYIQQVEVVLKELNQSISDMKHHLDNLERIRIQARCNSFFRRITSYLLFLIDTNSNDKLPINWSEMDYHCKGNNAATFHCYTPSNHGQFENVNRMKVYMERMIGVDILQIVNKMVQERNEIPFVNETTPMNAETDVLYQTKHNPDDGPSFQTRMWLKHSSTADESKLYASTIQLTKLPDQLLQLIDDHSNILSTFACLDVNMGCKNATLCENNLALSISGVFLIQLPEKRAKILCIDDIPVTSHLREKFCSEPKGVFRNESVLEILKALRLVITL